MTKKKPNNKNKGKRVELEISHLLTNITGIKFNRVGVSSGARFTKEGINANGFIGDIFTQDEHYKNLVIECKGTKKVICVLDLFNHKSLLNEYIDQCKRECDGKQWLLIVKMNKRDCFYLCYEDVINKFPKIFDYSIPIIHGGYFIGILKPIAKLKI